MNPAGHLKSLIVATAATKLFTALRAGLLNPSAPSR
jgi:hypothetical protein